MNTIQSISAVLQAELMEELAEAFTDLCGVSPDIESMAVAIGGAKYLLACALEKLGDSAPRKMLDAANRSVARSLSNSTAPIGTSAVKEPALTVPPSYDGELGDSLAPYCMGASESDLDALFAAALTAHETH